jgi:hypothetical protein
VTPLASLLELPHLPENVGPKPPPPLETPQAPSSEKRANAAKVRAKP